MKNLYYLLLLFILVQLAFNNDDNPIPIQTFQGSLFVSLKDLNGIPVQGALICSGTSSGMTEDDGN